MKIFSFCVLMLLVGTQAPVSACPVGGLCDNRDIGINLPDLPVWSGSTIGGIRFQDYHQNVAPPGLLDPPSDDWAGTSRSAPTVVDRSRIDRVLPLSPPALGVKLVGYMCETPKESCYVALPEHQLSGSLCGCVTKEKTIVTGALK